MYSILNFLSTASMTAMDYLDAILQLLAGLGAFLIGFKILSDNIEKLANKGIKKLFEKTGKNKIVGVGIGAGVSAIIQSSSAATVMIVGFVNAGIMSLATATCLIMGANIGTTITGQIVALQAFDITKFAMALTCVGIFIDMFAKKEKTKSIGLSLGGLGLVFLALSYMSGAMVGFRNSPEVIDLLSKCNNPFLLLLIGLGFTALIQSSSATATIVISMAVAGISIGTDCNSVLYVILGSNIGTCVTALISSIGTNVNAKRASIIHLLFNVIGSLIFFVMLLIWKNFMNDTFVRLFKEPATQIAMFHTFFNVTATLIFLPFTNLFVKASCLIIRDKKKEEVYTNLDERFLNNPSVALSQAKKEIVILGELCINTLNNAMDGFLAINLDNKENILEEMAKINDLNKNILAYLVKVTACDMTVENETEISKFHYVINDFYRSVEVADNVLKYTRHTIDDDLEFSEDVYTQLREFKNLLNEQFGLVKEIFTTNNKELLVTIDAVENKIDALRSKMINEHIKRLADGACSPTNCGVYINLVSNLERVGDHLNYAAQTIVE